MMALDPVTAVLDIGSRLIDRLWPNPVERDAAKAKLFELQQTGELAKLTAETDLAKGQLEINKTEAGSSSLFVSGWRPSVGWVCSAALVFQFILAPLITWGALLLGSKVVFPVLDTGTLVSLLMALLGIGGLRTLEKLNGVASK
jgi:hypothetical protein